MASALQSLLNAIYAQCLTTRAIVTAFPAFTDATSIAAYPVGVYRGLAPERAPLPYLVYTVIAAPTITRYGGVQRTEPLIQFVSWSTDDSDTAIRVFTGVFDELTLTLATGHMVNTTRMGDPVPMGPEKDDKGNNVWGWRCDYQFVISPA